MIHVDFSLGPQIYNKLFQDLSEKPIGLLGRWSVILNLQLSLTICVSSLVNNVGIASKELCAVHNSTPEFCWDMLYVNMGVTTQLCRHFVDLWHRKGFKGGIVNIASVLATFPCPYGATYGASKAYIRSFTLALQHEVKPFGITVQLISPNAVATQILNFSDFVRNANNPFVATPENFARHAVYTLGKLSITNGYFWHEILVSSIAYRNFL